MIFALDTNIISAMLKGESDVIACYHQELKNGNEFIIPPIVYYEIERGLLARSLFNKKRLFDEFCQDVQVGEFDFGVWTKAAQIYADLSKRGKPLGSGADADYFIAAFCIVNDYTLVSRNVKHFENIAELKFVDWK